MPIGGNDKIALTLIHDEGCFFHFILTCSSKIGKQLWKNYPWSSKKKDGNPPFLLANRQPWNSHAFPRRGNHLSPLNPPLRGGKPCTTPGWNFRVLGTGGDAGGIGKKNGLQLFISIYSHIFNKYIVLAIIFIYYSCIMLHLYIYIYHT